MRTNMRLDKELLAKVKLFAARNGRTLTRVIAAALRKVLAGSKRSQKAPPAKIPTFRGDGLQAGVNLDDTAALLSLMDEIW